MGQPQFNQPEAQVPLIEPFVREHLRHHRQQAVLNAVGIMLVVTMQLTIAATSSPVSGHRSAFAVAVREMIAAMAWVAVATAMLVVAVNRVSQVKDRTREFAILRVFGCTFGYIADVLLQETICVAVPGAVAGIVLAQINDSLIALAFRGLVTVKTPYMFWLPSGVIAATWFFGASLVGARAVMRLDVLEALGQET